MNGPKAAGEGSQIKESSQSLQAATVCSVCTGPHPGPLQVCDIRWEGRTPSRPRLKEQEVKWKLLSRVQTLHPMDCSPPGSIHGILQARILEWVVISFSRGSSQPRDRTQVSCIADRFFTVRGTRERAGKDPINPGLAPPDLTLGKEPALTCMLAP